MAQVRDRRVQAQAMVRSRAWRQGYASCRRGDDARFMDHGTKALAYEYGRLTAAWLKGEGQPLPWLSERRPLPDHLVRPMAEALMDCVAASAAEAPIADDASPVTTASVGSPAASDSVAAVDHASASGRQSASGPIADSRRLLAALPSLSGHHARCHAWPRPKRR